MRHACVANYLLVLFCYKSMQNTHAMLNRIAQVTGLLLQSSFRAGEWPMSMRGMIEHIVVQDVFCSGLGAIERLDGNVLRLWLYVCQTSEQTGGREKVVAAKILIPASAFPKAIGHMIAATSDEAMIAPLAADMTN